MATLDEQIARALEESRKSGELEGAKSWAKPQVEDRGFSETPDEFRMPFKILKDAGFVPPEVEMLREIATLMEELNAMSPAHPQYEEKRARLADLRVKTSVRLEAMRGSGRI
ncbi:DnaJ family domain-containing protein [Trinickia diaoshuihuensis]|uniref:DnaJ family domain-containing protein n=1 Tax=Trinickia diaoshuihuensis TaxID=2292265 RepID=UPI000E26859E|nr:DnaJ family domain-containing protein [Trinickia diaoshuihuensis]